MKVNRTTAAVMFATGVLAVLGFAGTALADGSDDTRPRTVAAGTETPSPDSSSDDSATIDPSPEAGDDAGDDVSPSHSSTPAGSNTAVTAAQAEAIAVRAAGGGRVESIEREREHGRLVWDIDVIVNGVEHDIDVDATTGKVTRHRTDKSGDDRTQSGDDSGSDDRTQSGDDSGSDDRGRGSDDTGSDDHGRGSDDSGSDDHGHGGDDD